MRCFESNNNEGESLASFEALRCGSRCLFFELIGRLLVKQPSALCSRIGGAAAHLPDLLPFLVPQTLSIGEPLLKNSNDQTLTALFLKFL